MAGIDSSADDFSLPVTGIMALINSLFPVHDKGTGIKKLVDFSHHLLGPIIPAEIIEYNIGVQNNLFGDYPTSADVAPSILFAALFGVLLFIHLIIFAINTSRGHYFYISLAWVVYCAFRVIGFALRAVWAKDVTKIAVGLTSEVFCIVASIVIVSFNLLLTQRLFTWRHPVGGSRKLFWFFMLTTYAFVFVVIAITVMASFIPYLHFLQRKAYLSYQYVVMASAILILLYSLTSIALLALSYWAPTKKDERLYTYQPWWIESFAPTYFVRKNAAQQAEETFMKRNSNHRHATRVIAATHHHYNMVEGLSTSRGDLSHNVSMGLIIISTVLIFIGAMGRAIVVFQGRRARDSGPATSIVFMYICWGAFEFIINVLYIVGRVDLRFYRPDILPAKVRAIITAEQSHYVSDNEDEDYPQYGGGGYYNDRSDAESYLDDDDADELNFQREPRLDDESYVSSRRSVGSDGSSISVVDEKGSYFSRSPSPPYPMEKKVLRDDESDFNF
ncbi:hypothetical protein DICA3_E22540 [Diutina catenulata]